MVVTTNNCSGPRAYAGLAFSYYEKITEDFERLDDPTWSDMIQNSPPEDVAWVSGLLGN